MELHILISMNFKYLLFAISIGILIFGGCNNSKTVADNTEPTTSHTTSSKRPIWVTQRPTDQNYYIGIAVSSKTASPTNFALDAQRNALNELASSIEVDVKSNSMLFSFEDQNRYRDEFKEFIQVKTNKNIENFELVDSWQNDYEYWVYYRLSKEQYKKDKQLKIDKATDLSLQLISQAENEWAMGNYRKGFIGFFEALEPIKPYLGESLPVTINSTKEVFLGNYLLSQITQSSRSFHVTSASHSTAAIWGGTVKRSQLTFSVVDEDQKPISQIPLKFSYSEGVIRPRDGITNQNGNSTTEIQKVKSKKEIQEVKSEIDFERLIIEDDRPDEIEKIIFATLANSPYTINIKVSSPKLYVQSNEKSLDKNSESMLKSAFEKEALAFGFVLTKTKSDSDVMVEIVANTQKAGISYDLKNAILSASFKITDSKSKKLIYEDDLNQVKGVSASFNEASNQAYLKAQEDVSKKIVPRFYRRYIN